MSTRHVSQRLDSLTGLRFLAAFVVFGIHATEYVPAGNVRGALDLVFSQGTAGVTFFFLLSGFVLAWSHRAGDTPRAFYRRRFARIAPAYWVTFLAGVALLIPIRDTTPLATVADSLPSAVGLQAWFPSPAVYYGGNGVGWSLSVEMFFYLLFPLLILGLQRRRILIALVAVSVVAMLAVPLILQPSDINSVEYWAIKIFPLQRLAEFVLGCALAVAMRRGWRFPVGLPAATALALVAYLAAAHVPGWAQLVLLPALPFLILIGAAAQADLADTPSIVRSRPFVVLGEWSYCFYLVHQMVIVVFITVAKTFDLETIGTIAVLLAALAVALVAAWALYVVVERPLERRVRGARPRPEMLQAAS